MSKRADERTPTSLPALMFYAGRWMECAVRDVSRRGAKIRVPDAGAVPQTFELKLKDSGVTRPAQVRWRRKAEIGVEFLPERRGFGRRLVPPGQPGGAPGPLGAKADGEPS